VSLWTVIIVSVGGGGGGHALDYLSPFYRKLGESGFLLLQGQACCSNRIACQNSFNRPEPRDSSKSGTRNIQRPNQTAASFSHHGPTVLSWALGAHFNFLILYTVGRTPCTGDQPVAWPLRTHRTTQTQYKSIYPGFEWNSNPRP
jgi:hypothetical protein